MNPAVVGILVGIAKDVGAPIVKSILEKRVGKAGAEIADAVIDNVIKNIPGAEKEEDILSAPPGTIDAAVVATEQVAPEIIAHYVEMQKLSNELQIREMTNAQGEKEPWWAWAWRPAWMWFLMVVWGFALLVIPVVNGVSGASIPTPDLAVLSTITAAYLALYMGGHTVKQVFSK